MRGEVELRNISFRYAETEPFVLENISLKVQAGSFVTIMGPSGGGKTTLLKIMLGLIEPTTGEILIDGIPLRTLGVRAYREQVAAVMQEDQLLSGSIADNISFFDPQFDHDRWLPARKWQVSPGDHGDADGLQQPDRRHGQFIVRWPEAARPACAALYRGPSILFLDEGTAIWTSRKRWRSMIGSVDWILPGSASRTGRR